MTIKSSAGGQLMVSTYLRLVAVLLGPGLGLGEGARILHNYILCPLIQHIIRSSHYYNTQGVIGSILLE